MTRNAFEDYYLQQARGGGLPVFIGGSQRGHGLGGILSGLARMVVPVLKRGGKSLIKETFRTGVDILGDVVSGSNIKTSAKRRLKQGGQRMVNKAVKTLSAQQPKRQVPKGGGIKGKKRSQKAQSKQKPKRRKTVQLPRDIFD